MRAEAVVNTIEHTQQYRYKRNGYILILICYFILFLSVILRLNVSALFDREMIDCLIAYSLLALCIGAGMIAISKNRLGVYGSLVLLPVFGIWFVLLLESARNPVRSERHAFLMTIVRFSMLTFGVLFFISYIMRIIDAHQSLDIRARGLIMTLWAGLPFNGEIFLFAINAIGLILYGIFKIRKESV